MIMIPTHSQLLTPSPPVTAYSYFATLFAKRYVVKSKLSSSLQGSVWLLALDGTLCVAKLASKSLYHKHVSVVNGHEVHVDEDIVKEAKILRLLSSHKEAPASLAKFMEVFQDTSHIFLVTEYAGTRLFDFVKKCHLLIAKGKLKLEAYLCFVRRAFRQIVECLQWMHDTMHCCHHDLSLENLAISGVSMTRNAEDPSCISSIDTFQIKMIDFGLAEMYNRNLNSFKSVKYAGKAQYKSPEMYAATGPFDARSADVWSLGVVLYMMTLGLAPFGVASTTDQYYCLIKRDGRLRDLLASWRKESYVTPGWLKLITSIFVDEKQRLNIKQIYDHGYCRNGPH